MTLRLYNTPLKAIKTFTPHQPGRVTVYTCGPTVYDHLHIGNWAAYVFWDTLVRILRRNDYQVERVMNITDVGHLVSDADDGEDKLEKGARREGKTAWEIAGYYTDSFIDGADKLGLLQPDHLARATDYIEEQLELVRQLKVKGYTYQINDGIYFDTSKFERYGDFAGLNLEAQKAGARVEYNTDKRNPTDFALWKFTPPGQTRDMEWETPKDLLGSGEWDMGNGESRPVQASATQGDDEHQTELYNGYSEGEAQSSTQYSAASASGATGSASRQASTVDGVVMGFPGWHLECSAIAMTTLGHSLDIHTGGIDHIPIHHTNEIAQSEAATGKTFASYWLHNNHLKSNGTKISKSLNNGFTLMDLEARGFDPLDYRLLVLQSHYRSESNFTFDNLAAARNRRHNWRNIAALRHQTHTTTNPDHPDQLPSLAASGLVKQALDDDLGTPQALQVIDEVFGELGRLPLNRIDQDALRQLIETIDELLGLQLLETTPDISDQAKQLILARKHARETKDWDKADQIRLQLELEGISVRDTPTGPVWEYLAN